MRRKEFEIRDAGMIAAVLQEAPIGYLAFNGGDGWPRITPVNFAFDGRVLWHGAVAGERFECLRKDPRATFSAVSAQVYIPSHFTSPENAAAASAGFKSVQVSGRCRRVEEPGEKCAILNRLMEKYQPEGKYRRIAPGDPLYQKILESTGVFALTPEEMVGKFKFAQTKPEKERAEIAARLRERGTSADRIIAAEILKTLEK